MNTRGRVADTIYGRFDCDKHCAAVEALLEDLFNLYDIDDKPPEVQTAYHNKVGYGFAEIKAIGYAWYEEQVDGVKE